MIEVRYNRGLYLPEADLWLDPQVSKPCAFVSHAHADHVARHESILCSDLTAALLRSRFRIAESRLVPSAFHVPVVRGGFRFRLIPAGHIPGSAMIHITRIADQASLLYTGDFKTRRSRVSEATGFLNADTLIMETTFGLPGYEFPSPMEVDASILRFVNDAFSDHHTPVLLGYSLGKAQEALALLAEHGIPVLMHPAAAAMTRACIEAGVPDLPEPVEFDGHAPPGHVLIAPPHATRSQLLRGLKAKRTAMLSGWALQPGARFRYRVDAMLPMSDHADHPGLLECIQRVRPKRILTVHGFAREFASELRTRGMQAWCAYGGDQLELPIQGQARRHQAVRAWHKRAICPLADFSDFCKLASDTGSLSAKKAFLVQYLGTLANDRDLETAVRWLATADGSRTARTGGLDTASLRRTLLTLGGAREERWREIHLTARDPLRAARLFLQELPSQPEPIDLEATAEFVRSFRASPPSLEREATLAARLGALHPAEGETVIRLLTGDLGTGIPLQVIEEAIAESSACGLEALREAGTLCGDLGNAAVLARHGTLDMAKPRSPESMPGQDEAASTPDLGVF